MNKPADFVVGTGPVLATERVQREDLYAASHAMTNDLADVLDAGGMAVHLRLTAGLRPAPVAVHDDGDVARQLLARYFERFRGGRVRRPYSCAGSVRSRLRLQVYERRGVCGAGYPTGH
jgi:hypothetical protein